MASGTIKNLHGAILQKKVTYQYTIPSATHTVTGSFTVPTISGYRFMGLVGVSSSHYIECFVNAWPANTTAVVYGIRDVSGYVTDIDVTYYLLYVRSDLANYQ